jgi:hypothetical protein
MTVAMSPGGCGRVSWYMPNTPDNGWDELTFPLTVHAAPNDSGWFFAVQFEFVGGHVGYCGIRVRQGGRALSEFTVFGDGWTIVDDSRCRPGAESESGVSCSAWGSLIHNEEYLFTVSRDSPGSRIWRGRRTDAETGVSSELGAWSLPHYGGLKYWQMGFMEHTEKIPSCKDLPLASLHFGAPYNAPTGVVGHCYNPETYGRCSGKTNFAAETQSDGRVWMRNGWPAGCRRDVNEHPKAKVQVTANAEGRHEGEGTDR